MYNIEGHLLCLDCFYKFQQIQAQQSESLEKMINYLSDQMDWTIGFSSGSPRFPERKPPIVHNAPVTLNSMNIDRSIVGSVNTGYIDNLDVSMKSVSQINNEGAEEIKEFAEAVLKEESLNKEQKEEIVQQLDFLSQQLSLSTEERNKGAIKSIVSSIASVINFSASLNTLWGPIASSLIR